MGVDIPQPFDSHVSGTVTVAGIPQPFNATVSGIPDTFHINIEKLPKIQLGVDPIEISMRIKELPSIRAHLPADFTVGLSLFGMDMLAIRLCGEAQLITEPYVPNPCEDCGPGVLTNSG